MHGISKVNEKHQWVEMDTAARHVLTAEPNRGVLGASPGLPGASLGLPGPRAAPTASVPQGPRQLQPSDTKFLLRTYLLPTLEKPWGKTAC